MSNKKKIVHHVPPSIVKRINNVTKGGAQNLKPVVQRAISQKSSIKFQPQFNPNYILNFNLNLNVSKRNRVFIVGGGPSLTSFDFSKLNNEDVIAVNKSIEFVNKAKYFITMDYTFISRNKLTNNDFNIIKTKAENSIFIVNVQNENMKFINGMFVDNRNNIPYTDLNKFTTVIRSPQAYDLRTGFGTSVENFAHGDNSGFCALQLALILGYEEIYLLGFDLAMSGTNSHFHNGYRQNHLSFNKNLNNYRNLFYKAINSTPHRTKIFSCSPSSTLNTFLKYVNIDSVDFNLPSGSNEMVPSAVVEPVKSIKPTSTKFPNLIVVGYYTVNTPYEQEAQGLINSCAKLNLNTDIVGIPTFGSWQSNTRFKAKFMLEMLQKYPGKDLLYVDCDAVIHSDPVIFANYPVDVAVRYQDFRWRKNECLSGTIFIKSNDKTINLCKKWIQINESEGPNAKTLEQWNLDKALQETIRTDNLIVQNLPPEYTFIFDSMRQLYPHAVPVIEHFQASRKFKNKV